MADTIRPRDAGDYHLQKENAIRPRIEDKYYIITAQFRIKFSLIITDSSKVNIDLLFVNSVFKHVTL